MKRATFNIRTNRGLEQREGWLTALPNYPGVKVTLHKAGWSDCPWVCSEYETGSVLASDCPKRTDAIRDAEFLFEQRGMERMLGQISLVLLNHGRANGLAA